MCSWKLHSKSCELKFNTLFTKASLESAIEVALAIKRFN